MNIAGGDFNTLRARYKIFEYNGFNYNISGEVLNISYSFSIAGLTTFSPSWRIPISKNLYDNKILERLIFLLGMMELVSYWKCVCSPTVLVNCGNLSTDEILWWKKLYFYGLQEFFYKNSIDTNIEDFLNITSIGKETTPTTNLKNDASGYLIPIGGGKDSCVTLELTKAFKNRSAFIIGDRNSSVESAKASGIDDILILKRTISQELLELNKNGFLNGHTPFSGIVAFSSLLTAYVSGKKYILLSNESSANEPTVAGTNINHQYSKSFEFEQAFREYVKNFTPVPYIEYLSMLRPLSELQIAGIFAKTNKYHKIFRSCNRGAASDKWCGECPKCLFVFLMLAVFLDYDDVVNALGTDILNNEKLSEDFAELIGYRTTKPFECVGTVDEVKYAVYKILEKLKNNNQKIPILLNEISLEHQKLNLQKICDQHNLPDFLLELVKDAALKIEGCS